jgi:hypothetical protein
MDPTSNYQQMMIQQLMSGNTMAPGMGGQNASTPYGAAFMTGNTMQPQSLNPGQNFGMQAQGGQQQGMLGQGINSVLQQPMATYA